MRFLNLAVILGLIAVPAFAGDHDLPDGSQTPGAVRTADAGEVCNPRHRTKDVRHVSEGLKRRVFEAYGLPEGNHSGYCDTSPEGCEIDHLISLELGGSNDIENLWPQTYDRAERWNAHVKDRLENELHRRVCSGRMALEEAQAMIAKDWVCAYRALLGEPQAKD